MLNKLKSIKDIETMRFKNILYRNFYVHIETKLLLMSPYKRIFNDFTMVSYMYRKFYVHIETGDFFSFLMM